MKTLITSEMFYQTALGTESLLLIAAGILLMLKTKRIRALNKQIIQEQHKRITPIVGIIPDRGRPALRISNDGHCLIKNLQIADVETVIDVGFQKKLTFRFDSIKLLQPGESAVLNIQVFEKGAPLPPSVTEKMGGVLLAASFLAEIRCENSEAVPFWIRLKKTGQDYTIEKISPLEESQ